MIQDFLDALDIPDACRLNKTLFKKLFLESGQLDVTDKKTLRDDIDKIRWLYTLKPSTINICLLYTSPSPRDRQKSRMPSSA